MIVDRDFAGVRLLGRRPQQQDYYAFCPIPPGAEIASSMLLAVADGAGGLENGQRASQAAVEGFMDDFVGSSAVDLPRLESALQAANSRVGSIREMPPLIWEDATAASTLVAVHATAVCFEWVSVGDSFLLHSSNGVSPRRCNADHSLRDDPERGGASRSSLRSALTGAPIPLIDRGRLPWREGDWLLAGTDGLLTVSEAEIADVLRQPGHCAAQRVQALTDLLCRDARQNQDNATITLFCNRLSPA